MAKNKGNKGNETVVGVFVDESHAQRAIQMLQQQGISAQVADKSAIGAFRDVGLEQEVADLYKGRHSEGNTLVIADAGNKGEQALNVMLQSGAEYIDFADRGGAQGASMQSGQTQSRDASYYRNLDVNNREYGVRDTTTGRGRNAEEIRIALREETLGATKQAVQAGEVEIRKTVHEKEQQIPVNLAHEEVYVDRRAVDRPADAGEIGDLQDEVIRVPVYEEQAQLNKQARVREEVTIGKNKVEEQQTLTGTTRHEHIEMDETGNVEERSGRNTNIRTDRTDDTYNTNA